MTEKAIQARRLYQRKWYHDHPEKARLYKDRYWEKKAEELEKAEEEKSAAEMVSYLYGDNNGSDNTNRKDC